MSKKVLFVIALILAILLHSAIEVDAQELFDNDYERHLGEDNVEVQAAINENATDPSVDSMIGYKDITQVFITTENNESPNHNEYINASMSIKADNASGEEIGIEYTTGKIKVRGNSTAGLDKKPYNIKFNSKVEILGFKKGKKYCLLANRYDKSCLRNYLAFTLSNESVLEYTPEFRFVDVWLNGNYTGNYLLTTPIEVSKTRLNIDTDGYDALLERNVSRVENGVTYLTSPVMNVRLEFNEPEDPTKDQINHVKQVLYNAEATLQNSASLSINEIANYIDIDSFLDFYLIEEFFKNRDVHYYSTRFYIKNDKLYASPCWDFDLCAGNFPEDRLAPYTGIYALTKDSPWIYALMQNSEFKSKFINRYKGFQYAIQKIPYYSLESIDYLYRDSFKRDKDVAGWDYRAQGLDRQPESTHKGNVAFLKDWLINRNKWLLDYFNLESLNYSRYYDNYYKAEILSRKYEDIANDEDIRYALSIDSSVFATQEDIDNYTNILQTALDRHSDEIYEDINDVIDNHKSMVQLNDRYMLEYTNQVTYKGRANNKSDDFDIVVTDTVTGETYSGKSVKLRVKNSKNVGEATIQVRSVKGIKNSKSIFKKVKFNVDIIPLPVNNIVTDSESYTQDGDLIIDMKNSSVKRIYVLIRRGDKIKKYRGTYDVNNNQIIFKGNFTGIKSITFT